MNRHERGFVESFVIKQKRSRYLDLLPERKRRAKVLAGLSSGQDVDYSVVSQKLPTQVSAALEILRRLGAPTQCYVIADDHELDGTELPLEEALEFACQHSFGVALSLVPGRLAVFKHESPSPMYVLLRP